MYASLAQYVHANPSHQDPGLAIIDSGNNKHHSLKEKVHSAEILLGFVPTDMNVSDIGTKPLAKSKFVAFRDKLLYGYQSPLVVPDGTSHFLQHVHLNMHYTSVDSQQFEPVFALALFPLSRLQRPFKTTPQLQLQQ